MNNVSNNQSFNGMLYKIADKKSETRGYVLGLTHKTAVEGTKQPTDFSEFLKKKFGKSNLLILEINPLQNCCKEEADVQRKTNFYMDYKLAICANNENKEIKELETADFQRSLMNKLSIDSQQQQVEMVKEITSQVLASGKYKKAELLEKKIAKLGEYKNKKDLICEELSILYLKELDEERKNQIQEKTKQNNIYRSKVNKLVNAVIDLQQEEEVIHCRGMIKKIYDEKNKEATEFIKSIYEISDETKMEKFLKVGMSFEMAKQFWDDRNVGMVDKINDVLEKVPGKHFIAIGKGHLVGQMGVVALLREKGWKVEQIKKDSLVF